MIIKSLDAATATGPGVAAELGEVANIFTGQSIVTGSPTSWEVDFEGSLDGVNWATVAAITQADNSIETQSIPPVRFLRANLKSFSGGSSPAFTIILYTFRVNS
jgi:hypothetical protein